MLLRALVESSASSNQSPRMYQAGEVHWALELATSGAYLGWTPLMDSKGRGRRLLRPHASRTSFAVRPKLLADTGEYVLGTPRNTRPADRTPKHAAFVRTKHETFVRLIEEAAETTRHPDLMAAAAFYRSAPTIPFPDGWSPDHVVALRIGGRFPMDDPIVRQFWAAHTRPGTDRAAVPCLVCGQPTQPVQRLPSKVKGIPGGQSSGTALVSVNQSAFESFGREAALNSPICMDCAQTSHDALNQLLADKRTHLAVGPVVYAFWTRDRDVGFSPLALLESPSSEDVRALLRSEWTGDAYGNAFMGRGVDRFYACALSANGARAVVRTWLDSTVAQVQQHLAEWFSAQALVDTDGGPGSPLGIRALTDSLYRERKDLSPQVSSAFVTAALTGGHLDHGVLLLALRRSRVDSPHVPRARAMVIKLALLSLWRGGTIMNGTLTGLDPHYPEPAYHWGRLLAELESIQRAAIPRADSTLIDRYFGAASTAPGRIYSVLIRNAQPHLAKLRRDNERQYYAHQRRLEEIQAALAPGSLSVAFDIAQQGLFALGYYHQRADQRRQIQEALQRRGEHSLEEVSQE